MGIAQYRSPALGRPVWNAGRKVGVRSLRDTVRFGQFDTSPIKSAYARRTPFDLAVVAAKPGKALFF